MSAQEAIIVMSYIVPATISVGYIIAMIFRFMQLRADGSVANMRFNCPLMFRTTTVAEVTSVILSIFYQGYYAYDDALAMLVFINITAISLQIYLMLYEYNKRVPLFAIHKIYWIANWIVITLLIILLFEDSIAEFANYGIQLIRWVLYTTLLFYTLFIRHQDIYEFETLPFFQSHVPEMDSATLTELQRSRLSTVNVMEELKDKQTFIVEVRKRWNIIDGQFIIKMDITLFPSGRKIQVKRAVKELIEMHQSLMNECAEYFEHNPNVLQELTFLLNQIGESQAQTLISNITKYILIINQRVELGSTAFMDFICLPNADRPMLDDHKHQNGKQSDTQKSMKNILSGHQSKLDVNEEYLPYFNITINEHLNVAVGQSKYVQYTVTVKSLRDDQQHWIVYKRFKDFYELNETLKQFLNVKQLPPLPKKKLIQMSEEHLDERQYELEVYLKNLLNDRTYHHYSLFNFITLNKEQVERVKKLQQIVRNESMTIERLGIFNMGYEESIDSNGQKYYRYIFQINAKSTKWTIYKRFSQFDDLNQVLKIKFQASNDLSHLPQFPLKYTAFQQKINPEQREQSLIIYFKALLKVPFIGESIHFRQFLEIKQISEPSESGVRPQAVSIQDLETIFKQLEEANDKDSDKLEVMHSGWSK